MICEGQTELEGIAILTKYGGLIAFDEIQKLLHATAGPPDGHHSGLARFCLQARASARAPPRA